jgi:hypothetical protein
MIIYAILIIILLLIFCNKSYENQTNTPATTNEALQYIGDMYNQGMIQTNAIKLGNKMKITSGNDFTNKNDSWLRIMNHGGNGYGPGIAASNLFSASGFTLNSPTGIVHSSADGVVIGSDDHDIKLKRKYDTLNVWSGSDLSYIPRGRATLQQVIDMCKNDARCDRIITSSTNYHLRHPRYNNHFTWIKDTPESHLYTAATSGHYAEKGHTTSTTLQQCIDKCKANNECDHITWKHDNNCWQRRSTGSDLEKTIFIPKGF